MAAVLSGVRRALRLSAGAAQELHRYMLHDTCYILHPTSYILHPTVCILHAACHMLRATRYTLHTTSYSVHIACNLLPTTCGVLLAHYGYMYSTQLRLLMQPYTILRHDLL